MQTPQQGFQEAAAVAVRVLGGGGAVLGHGARPVPGAGAGIPRHSRARRRPSPALLMRIADSPVGCRRTDAAASGGACACSPPGAWRSTVTASTPGSGCRHLRSLLSLPSITVLPLRPGTAGHTAGAFVAAGGGRNGPLPCRPPRRGPAPLVARRPRSSRSTSPGRDGSTGSTCATLARHNARSRHGLRLVLFSVAGRSSGRTPSPLIPVPCPCRRVTQIPCARLCTHSR